MGNTEDLNFLMLAKAIVNLSGDVLRTILKSHTEPQDLEEKLKPKRKDLRKEQWSCIEAAANSKSYEKFDVTLSYEILRWLFNQDLRQHLKKQMDPKKIDDCCNDQLLYKIYKHFCCPHEWLKKEIDPSNIKTFVENCQTLVAVLTEEEKKQIEDIVSSGSYDGCNEPLLDKLYKHLCRPQIPSNGWGKDPDPNSTECSDDIERLRLIRNSRYAHISSTIVDDIEFESQWRKLEDIMERMSEHFTGLNKDFKKDLDDIKSSSTGTTPDEVHKEVVIYKGLLEKLSEMEEELLQRMDKVDERMDKVDERMDKVDERMDKVDERTDKVDERMDKVDERTDKVEEDLQSTKDRVTALENQNNQIPAVPTCSAEQTRPASAAGDAAAVISNEGHLQVLFDIVASHLPRESTQLGVHLGLTSNEIDEIKEEHKAFPHEQIFQILWKWFSKNTDKDHVRDLNDILSQNLSRNDVVRALSEFRMAQFDYQVKGKGMEKVTAQDCTVVASAINRDTYKLLRFLSLEQMTIDGIRTDYYDNIREQTLQMLTAWMKKDLKCTKNKLCSGLKYVKRNDIIKKLETRWGIDT